MANPLTAEEMLAGAAATFTVALPARVLRPGEPAAADQPAREVVLRPLQIRDLDRVARAAKEQRVLTSVLLVQQALVSPKLSVEQVGDLPAGTVQFLLEKVNSISGLSVDGDDLDRVVRAPLAKACFVLAREFGWTPSECAELTVGQVLLYLEMLGREGKEAGVA
jgi:hypothetical protein